MESLQLYLFCSSSTPEKSAYKCILLPDLSKRLATITYTIQLIGK